MMYEDMSGDIIERYLQYYFQISPDSTFRSFQDTTLVYITIVTPEALRVRKKRRCSVETPLPRWGQQHDDGGCTHRHPCTKGFCDGAPQNGGDKAGKSGMTPTRSALRREALHTYIEAFPFFWK